MHAPKNICAIKSQLKENNLEVELYAAVFMKSLM